MNQNNDIFNKNEIENKLKDFKEGQDYSILRENDKATYNFRNIVLNEIFKRDYITVYEAAENWDSDNYNYHRETAEYAGKNGSKITYRYEHRINKNADYYAEWSWGEKFEDSSKATWSLKARPNPNFNNGYFLPGSAKVTFLEDLKWKYNQLTGKLNSLLSRPESDFGVNGKEKKEYEVAECKRDIADIEREIEKEKSKNSVRTEDNRTDDLQKENHDLRQQLAEVKQQLAAVLEELRKLRNNSTSQNSEKLNRQIVHNEKLIEAGEKVSLSEVQEQVNKSQALLKEAVVNTTVAPTKDNKDNGSLPYLIGGSVAVTAVALIGYYLVKKNKREKVA